MYRQHVTRICDPKWKNYFNDEIEQYRGILIIRGPHDIIFVEYWEYRIHICEMYNDFDRDTFFSFFLFLLYVHFYKFPNFLKFIQFENSETEEEKICLNFYAAYVCQIKKDNLRSVSNPIKIHTTKLIFFYQYTDVVGILKMNCEPTTESNLGFFFFILIAFPHLNYPSISIFSTF